MAHGSGMASMSLGASWGVGMPLRRYRYQTPRATIRDRIELIFTHGAVRLISHDISMATRNCCRSAVALQFWFHPSVNRSVVALQFWHHPSVKRKEDMQADKFPCKTLERETGALRTLAACSNVLDLCRLQLKALPNQSGPHVGVVSSTVQTPVTHLRTLLLANNLSRTRSLSHPLRFEVDKSQISLLVPSHNKAWQCLRVFRSTNGSASKKKKPTEIRKSREEKEGGW